MRNDGAAATGPVRVRLSLPEGVFARGGGGSRCTQDGRVAECFLTDSLAAGAQSTVRISLHVSVFSAGGPVSGTVYSGPLSAPVGAVRVDARRWF
ncbi:hypothetical protein GCM10010452_85590 [Crossiella cryophila]